MLLFKANYGYKLRILLLLYYAKKSSKIVKEKIKTLINYYRNLKKLAKLVQEYIKRYYNLKVSEGPDLKGGDKV